MARILIIDDERAIRNALREILEYENYQVDDAEDGPSGIEFVGKESYDVILCDIKMPKMDGIEVLENIQKTTDAPVVMISGHGTIETAVEAIRKGAYDFISKPLDLNRLLITLRNAMDKSRLVTETKALKRKVSKQYEMIGESPAIVKIKDMIERVAATDARVLIDRCPQSRGVRLGSFARGPEYSARPTAVPDQPARAGQSSTLAAPLRQWRPQRDGETDAPEIGLHPRAERGLLWACGTNAKTLKFSATGL